MMIDLMINLQYNHYHNYDGEEQVTFEQSQLSQHTRLLLTDEWPCKQWDEHFAKQHSKNQLGGRTLILNTNLGSRKPPM